MRLSEFASPKYYAPTVADAEGFLQQLVLTWPDQSASELAPSVLCSRKQPPFGQTKISAALSIGSHIGGGDLRSRCGDSQWPTA
jgi:hypothetical protein